MFIYKTPEARVNQGAKWLDEVMPEWEKCIPLDQFDISSSSHCIMGHLSPNEHGMFSRSVYAFIDCYGDAQSIKDFRAFNDAYEWGSLYGFEIMGNMNSSDSEYRALQRAWVKAINKRL